MVNPTSSQSTDSFDTNSPAARVLIVDRSAENREVLRTMLQRSGCEIFESDKADAGLTLAEKCHPQVLVLDLDTVNPAGPNVLEGFDEQARSEKGSVLLLGRIPKSVENSSSTFHHENVVAKPYHYAPLIRKIEALLRQAEPARETRRGNHERT